MSNQCKSMPEPNTRLDAYFVDIYPRIMAFWKQPQLADIFEIQKRFIKFDKIHNPLPLVPY